MADAKEVNFELVGLMGEYLEYLVSVGLQESDILTDENSIVLMELDDLKAPPIRRLPGEEFDAAKNASVDQLKGQIDVNEKFSLGAFRSLSRRKAWLKAYKEKNFLVIFDAFLHQVQQKPDLEIEFASQEKRKVIKLRDCLFALREASGQ